MGLSPAVLRQLLVTDASAGPSRRSTGEAEITDEPEMFEFEFEVGANSSPKEVLLDPVFDEEDAPQPSRFRVRMLSESEDSMPGPSTGAAGSVHGGTPAPLSVTEMLMSRSQDAPTGGRFMGSPMESSMTRTESPSRVVMGDGVTAHYVFTGEPYLSGKC